MKEILVSYTKYNQWANQRLCKRIGQIEEHLWDTELKSSFKTIKQTLLHMWDAQQIWYHRLNGKSPNLWPSKNFTGTNNELIEQFLSQSGEITAFVESHKDELLNAFCEFNDMKGNPHKVKVCDIIQHCMNHSTFHRGQIVTMLRELGIENLPQTDYITYIRELQG